MTATTQMTNLFTHLQGVGIPKAFARKVLPDWWDDSITSSDAGLQQAQLYLSKAFNLDIASLVSEEEPPRFRQVVHKFKMNKNVSEDQVTASAHYATAMARLALQATDEAYTPPSVNPIELRDQILQAAQCVDLSALLMWCKTAGIPVLHIEQLPGKKMTGLAIRLHDRFAVVLSRKAHPSELLFHLAHELGHIANGHLNSDGFLADLQIGAGDRGDADEKEADAYAIRLLNGVAVKYSAGGRIVSGVQLYRAAKALSERERIDVGHIILNYGHAQEQFPLAKAALKHVAGSDCGSAVVNSALFEFIDDERLSEDQLTLLHTATNFSAI
jgi:hypothetical protein